MISKINSKLIELTLSHFTNTGLELGKAIQKNKRTPIYPTPSCMNLKIPQNVMLEGGSAICKDHKAPKNDFMIFHYIEDYVKTKLTFVSENKKDILFTLSKNNRKIFASRHTGEGPAKTKVGELVTPAYFDYEFITEPHYFIDKLWSKGKNTGTNSVKEVVLRSIQDPETKGRVMLDACNIDGKTSPVGFYYKLGFRSTNPTINTDCAKWIAEGGKKEAAPMVNGIMYLPKENIQHCLNYGLNIKA